MEAETYQQIKLAVKSILEIDLEPYKDQQMQRRLDSWLTRRGASSWDLYFNRLHGEPDERTKFRNYLTINVSSFFRDGDRWEALQSQVLPGLIETAQGRRPPQLNVWSAGCSIGAEAYTLAMILEEEVPGSAYSILATDLDKGALEKARAGGPYTADEIENIPKLNRTQYMKPGGPPFYLNGRLSQRISFREQNLLTDPFDEGVDLIVCRNVVIYFTAEAKTTLYTKFAGALRPGGVLFVGATEIIPRPHEYGLRTIGISFYEKK